MPTFQVKLADSLSVLKQYQELHPDLIIKGMDALGAVHTKRLIENGYLQNVIKGWYIPSLPGNEGDTTVWYASYWNFIAEYANSRFGNQWSLSAEQSLSFYAGESVTPSQLIIRSPKGSNTVTNLMYGDSLLSISVSLPQKIVTEHRFGINLYSLEEALIFCSPQYFKADALNARTCLYSISNADELAKILIEGGNSVRAGRVIGALRSVGRDEMADFIAKTMKRAGHDIREENPFAESTPSLSLPTPSPYAARIALLWQTMSQQISSLQIPSPQSPLSTDEILNSINANYVKDSYHSLSIEGYRVTESLIEQVRSRNWNPTQNADDAERSNALVARGYYQAFEAVKQSVAKILNGENPGEVAAKDHDDWHFELFQPTVAAGLTKASDLIGYRNHQVYIRGSRHTPPNPDAVRVAMPAFCECLKNETNPFVRAILGHFFLAYIHPYMDGNGRTARFLMNALFITAGYPWTIIPIDRRQQYMEALEKARTDRDILPFAKIILSRPSPQQ